MNIHEFQAKEILSKYGIPVPKGYIVSDPSASAPIYDKLGTPVVVVKAQIHAGGRGKAGGVKLAKSKEEMLQMVDNMIGTSLVTPQTDANRKEVLKVLVEEGMDIEKEFYIGITLDRSIGQPVLMVSTEGGMDIEEVADKTPEKIYRENIIPSLGLQRFQAVHLAYCLGFSKEEAKSVIPFLMKLWEVYDKEDCSLIEVNPLVLTKDKKILALDCKINFDENALYRHPENRELRDETEEDALEVKASKYNLNYVRLDGNVGCMVNGAGLAMGTMDIIKYAGAFPANFLDVGGGANVDTVTNAFKIILSDKNVKAIFVNIFGGIVRCDRIALGIIEATKKVDVTVPLVVRLSGTNSELAKKILIESGLKLEVADTLEIGSQKIVASLES